MEKLTKEQIQFIETYLENSDIYYADIRMEMTDHVASAIEKEIQTQPNVEFYSIFKEYMVKNKASLLANNKMFLRNVDKSILKRLSKQLFKNQSIFLFTMLVVIGYKALPLVDPKQLFAFATWVPFFSIVPFVIIYFVTLKTFKILRFSGIERLAFVYMIFYQFLNLSQILFRNHLESKAINYVVIAVTISLLITITIVLLQLTYLIINDYRKRFKYLS